MATWDPQANDVFLEALALRTAGERRQFLDRVCVGNPSVRAQVESLLEASERVGNFLERPAVELVGTVDEPPAPERPGTAIGPYKLLEPIGEGGFGVVYMAEQTEPMRRKVALKVLKPGMDSKQVVARFEAERQAIALMDHPNIARVLDAGATPSGRPYFVMVVRGVPITQFCDESRLTPRERLELFVSVCQAVQHAHQKGIIHRDIKPSNVLVTLHDGVPVVKVIDFGVAKALGQQLTDKTLFTGFAQMIGTPLYMSPEQAEMSGLDIDTRTDVYALGVLLYELLTGTTPFDAERLRKAGYDEMRRIIREEEPARPSTRVSTLGRVSATVSARRKSDPRQLSQLFRRELDWVVMKALEKDRNRRYESASAFAADVRRFLTDEPVLACPPSAWYRFRKFARRHRAAVAMASVVAAALLLVVVGLAVSVVLTRQSFEQERRTSYFQRIALAEREGFTNNLSRAFEVLEQCPEDLRGWEWRYLQRHLRGKSPLSLPHDEGVNAAAISPDGQRIVSADMRGFLTIWDAHTGEKVRAPFRGHEKPCYTLAFSPDGVHLASGGDDGSLKIWEAHTWQLLRACSIPASSFHALAFSPDGRRLASSSSPDSGETTISIWDPLTGEHLQELGRHEDQTKGLAFSPDGKLVASASFDQTVRLCDTRTGKTVRTFHGDRKFWSVAFSPDGRLVATGGGGDAEQSGGVRIWEVETGRERPPLTGHATKCVTFSPDGQRLATGGPDQTVRIWDTASGQEILTLRGHTDWVMSLTFSPDGQRLISAGDQTVGVWDGRPRQEGEARGEEIVTLRGHTDSVNAVAFHPRERRLATAGTDGTVKMWDTQTWSELRTIPTAIPKIEALAFSPDGRQLAVGGVPTRFVSVLDSMTGAELRRLNGPPSGVWSLAFSPDGKRLAVGTNVGAVLIWDVETGVEVRRLEAGPDMVVSVAFHPDPQQKVLVSAGGEGVVRIWDGTTGQELAPSPLKHPAFVASLAFSPDGRRLASSAWDRTVRVWDTRTWKQAQIFYNQTATVQSVAFSPNGRLLAWGATDSTIAVWQETTGAVRTLRGHLNRIQAVTFSPDNKLLASASQDGTAKIWPLP